MTEIEIALASMTLSELREAGQFIDALRMHFERSGRTIEEGRVASTEGPSLALDGLALAWFREVAGRYGADEWFAGMPTRNHQFGPLLDILIERMALVPESERRLQRKGVEPTLYRRQVCDSCATRLIASDVNFERIGDHLSTTCRSCQAGLSIRRPARPEVDIPEDEQRQLAGKMVAGLEAETVDAAR